MGRAPCCDKANVKRGPWSPQEDDTLKNYLHKHGTSGNWISLPQRAGLKRCGKSCRLRWLNYLRPDIKHGAFSEEEDNIIISLYYKMGSRWSVIAANLPGRTDNDVKNHWNTKLKKKLFSGSNTKFNSKIDIPFTTTCYTNIFQPPHPSPPTPITCPIPTYVDNTFTNMPYPSFSTLLAQCTGATNSPFSFLPNFTMENSFTCSTTAADAATTAHCPNYLSCYDPLHQLSSALNMGPPEEASSASGSSSVVYESSLEDDPFFAELGLGSMINPTCDYDDQRDIKPQGLGQSVPI